MALTLSDKKQVRPLNGAIVRSFAAASAGELGDWIYVDSNGKVSVAQADDTATSEVAGMVVSIANELTNKTGAFVIGDTVGVCMFGPVAGFSGMTAGEDVYLSAATAGASTQTVPANPNYTKVAARAAAPDLLWVNALNTPVNVQTSV